MPIGGRLENMDWFENEDVLDEMIYQRYNHSDAFRWVNKLKPLIPLFNLASSFRPSTRSLRQIKDGKMTLLISRLYVRSNKYRNDVFGLTRSMFANPLEMIVERGFPLLRRINHIIATLRDAGIMSKLIQDFNYNMTILTSIREMKAHKVELDPSLQDLNLDLMDDENPSNESPEIVLTTEHLEGAFSLLFVGLFITSVVFILELIFHSKIFKKVVKFFWRKIRCHRKVTKVAAKNLTRTKLTKLS